MNGKHYVGQKALTANTYRTYEPITQVVLWLDNNNCHVAGDDSGRVIEADCPYATQEMAEAVLQQLNGYVYKPVEADGARITPVAELGDAITVNGIYTQLGYQNIRFSNGEVMDIAAPGGGETLHEYQVQGELSKDFEHQIAETHSEISKTAEEIRLEVSNEIEGLSSSFSVQLDSITSTVQGQNGQISQIQQTVNSISSTVNGLDGQVSNIEQKVDNIRLNVSNGSTSSTISISVDGVTVDSANISMNGLVTYTGLANGTTTINGGCIKTGTIDADRLNLTGSITFGDLSSSVQNDINDAYSMAQSAQGDAQEAVNTVSGWTYPGSTYIDGEMIMSGTVKASSLQGGEVILLDSWEEEAGSLTLQGASSYDGAKITMESGALEFNAQYGDVYLEEEAGAYIQISHNGIRGRITFGTSDICSNEDGYWTCGRSAARWSDVYCMNSTNSTSDRAKKQNINYDMSRYDILFDSLKPASFEFIDGTSGRTHTGFIAQDIEEILEDCGFTSQEFAAFVKAPVLDEQGQETGNYDYFLRYGEFVPLCIYEIQQLKARIETLEASA